MNATAQFLCRYNAWRRSDESSEMPNPFEIGQAIDTACEMIEQRDEMLKALEDQELVDAWIESADVSSPFFEETLRHKLNHARDLRQSAIAKAKGDKQ